MNLKLTILLTLIATLSLYGCTPDGDPTRGDASRQGKSQNGGPGGQFAGGNN